MLRATLLVIASFVATALTLTLLNKEQSPERPSFDANVEHSSKSTKNVSLKKTSTVSFTTDTLEESGVLARLPIASQDERDAGERAADLPDSAPLIEEIRRSFVLNKNRQEYVRNRVIGSFRVADVIPQVSPASVDDLRTLADHYDRRLQDLADEIIVLLGEAYVDFYGNGNFRCFPSRSVATVRSKMGSHFTTNAIWERCGYACDVGFRSADYPHLNQLFKAAAEVRSERKQQVAAFVSSN